MRAKIRPAKISDVSTILAIHNEVIRERSVALEIETKKMPEEEIWFKDHEYPYGIWVIEFEKEIVGWASLNKFSSSVMHKFNTLLSIYITKAYRRKGFGKQLMRSLIKEGKKRGFHKIVLMVFTTNAPAIGLYDQVGFRRVGIFQEHRFIDGVWNDTLIMERILR